VTPPVAFPRRPRPPPRPPLTPLVDALLILLVFFMVTSTYAPLGALPMAEPAGASSGAEGEVALPLLIRLDAGGDAHLGGRALPLDALAAEAARRLEADPDAALLILPSPAASVQALVSLIDALGGVGATRVSVLRLGEGTR
jgi:biopolymer transport protein ExbD